MSEIYERFTERGRQVIVLAQDEARGLKHNYIGSEHLLLGLLREESGIGARALVGCGLELDEAREHIRVIIGDGDEVVIGHIPFTPRAKKSQELALRSALSLGHNYIGTEHLLLGLLRASQGGVVERILIDFELSPEKIEETVVHMLMPRHRVTKSSSATTIAKDTYGWETTTTQAPPELSSATTGFELTDEEKEEVDLLVDRLLVLSVRQWLALRSRLIDIDPPGGSFVREPAPIPGPRPSRAAMIRPKKSA